MPHPIGRRAALAMPSQARCHITVPLTRAVLGPILCPVTVNPVAGSTKPESAKAHQRPPLRRRFFCARETLYGGPRGGAFGLAGFLCPGLGRPARFASNSQRPMGGGELLTSAKEFHHV